uniref:UPF0598 protein C8orf82 homolog n=1 Tax=Myxine glutinosa TaxID=7769 RepID=UPI00358E90FF
MQVFRGCVRGFADQVPRGMTGGMTVTGRGAASAARAVYQQGQALGRGLREYFYYVDHQGQLFLDDTKVKNFITCYKDRKFLAFFFRQLKRNHTGRYARDFPYVSLCGRERNFLRSEDRPVVFTETLEHDGDTRLLYGGAGDGTWEPFQPAEMCMLPRSGRVYHPAPARAGGVGLIKSSLAIQLSPQFLYDQGDEGGHPSHFVWKETQYRLTQRLWKLLNESPTENTKSEVDV